jgi:FkbM family methyltransferase
MSYSQNGEDKIIWDYFAKNPPKKKRFLDIGANDGTTLSNTALLANEGWAGVCIEPAPNAYEKLYLKYAQSKKVKCYKVAIASMDCEAEFWQSGQLITKNDTALVSTLDFQETKRWAKSVSFDPCMVECFTFESFLQNFKIKNDFSFVSIDAEGLDFQITAQIDFTNVQVACVEWNSIASLKKDFEAFFRGFYMNCIHINAENLIFVK